MNRFLYILILFSLVTSCGKKKEPCELFKYGKFKVFFDEEKVESFYILDRTQNEQIETDTRGNKIFYTIKWLSHCSYISLYNPQKNQMTEDMIMVNEDGGIVVILESNPLGGKCIKYTSYVKNFKEASERSGYFCMEE